MILTPKNKDKAWLVAVDMGYGHQRAAYPLKHLAFEEKIINANNYQGITEEDRAMWTKAKAGYEFISSFRRIPLIGKIVFGSFDRLQRILSFYPRRDLSKPNLQLKQTLALIKKGWGRHLIKKLSEKPLPFIGTFFTAVFMAEHFNYPGEIYCVVCDTDISRTWASLKPQKSKIKYFAPTERVVERLKLYGVKKENIFLTGFPLPRELIGGEEMGILKEDLKYRMLNLDPQGQYFKNYKILVEAKLGKLPQKPDHPLTIMFAVGGAGAQKELGVKIVKNLGPRIRAGEVKIILVAGIRQEVRDYFLENTKGLDIDPHTKQGQSAEGAKINEVSPCYGVGVDIIFERNIEDYFQKFNQALRKTDILWTKPSELSFYSVLGLPIIIASPIGSQEEFNKRWLSKSGFGIPQESPNYINQWFFDWLEKGYLAEAAMQGFIEGEKLGTLNIKKICFG